MRRKTNTAIRRNARRYLPYGDAVFARIERWQNKANASAFAHHIVAATLHPDTQSPNDL